ncbi:MAG: hypothetical protein KGL53_00425 [Elusimicrobia bacterium]|nr:hypothetical protein [Elusimicrobiota bacterium]
MRAAALLLAVLTAAPGAWAGPALDKAVRDAGLRRSDPLPVKVEKVLRLLNDRQYLGETPARGTLAPPFDKAYNLDALRAPERILAEHRGGYCNSAAVTAAALLVRAGVPERDLRVVQGTNDADLAVVCPRAGKPRAAHPYTGASGHVFVAVKWTDGAWRLVNTVDSGRDYEWAPWYPPARVRALMREGPLPVPHRAAFRGPYKPMTVVQFWRPGKEPLHDFDGHLDIIASGRVGGRVCRYGPPPRRRSAP